MMLEGDTPKEKFYGKQTIYGKEGEHETPYLTRYFFWRFHFHIFHRGDQDPDPHDHPWDFWTFPLTGYYEEYMDADGSLKLNKVEPFQFHFRPATYTHRVLWPYNEFGYRKEKAKIYTIIYKSKVKSKWGFWVKADLRFRKFIPWRDYIYGKEK